MFYASRVWHLVLLCYRFILSVINIGYVIGNGGLKKFLFLFLEVIMCLFCFVVDLLYNFFDLFLTSFLAPFEFLNLKFSKCCAVRGSEGDSNSQIEKLVTIRRFFEIWTQNFYQIKPIINV